MGIERCQRFPLPDGFNGSVHEVARLLGKPRRDHLVWQRLGSVYANPLHGASVPFAVAGQEDKPTIFVSLDIAREAGRLRQGYVHHCNQGIGSILVALVAAAPGLIILASKDPKSRRAKPRIHTNSWQLLLPTYARRDGAICWLTGKALPTGRR